MNYKEYLKSPKWKELRKKAWKRANGKCEYCKNEACATHHVTYPKRFEEDNIDNLIVVCKKCHELNHGIRDDDRLLEEIQIRIGHCDKKGNSFCVYNGLDMSGERNEDIVGRGNASALESRRFNFELMKKIFPKYVTNLNFDKFQLHCWKGGIWWGKEEIGYDPDFHTKGIEKEFNGWASAKIIQWIIQNKGVEKHDSIPKV